MMYLITEILVWLLVAAAIGFAAAWFIRGALGSQAAAGHDAAAWSVKLTAAEADFEARYLAAEAANARLKADLHAAQTRATSIESDGGRRTLELEQALRTQVRAAEALASERGHALDQARTMFSTANAEWRARIGAAEDQAASVAAELEAAHDRLAAASIDAERLSMLEGEIATRDQMIESLRALALAAEDASSTQTSLDAAVSAEVEYDLAEIEGLRARVAELEAALAAASAPRRSVRTAPAPGEDDLLAITGIGPVMERALKAQGITTYRALASLDGDQVRELGQTMRNSFAERSAREKWQEQARTLHAAKYGEEI